MVACAYFWWSSWESQPSMTFLSRGSIHNPSPMDSTSLVSIATHFSPSHREENAMLSKPFTAHWGGGDNSDDYPPGGVNSEGEGLPSCECDRQGDLRPEARPLCPSFLSWTKPGIASWLPPADVMWELWLMLVGVLRRMAACCSRGQKNFQLGVKTGSMNTENSTEDTRKRDIACLSRVSTSHCCRAQALKTSSNSGNLGTTVTSEPSWLSYTTL